MEFFAIMFVGTVIAIWAVAGSRPTRKLYRTMPPINLPGAIEDDRNAEVWQFQPMDGVEHLEALELHHRDPVRNPAPSPAPPIIQN